MGNYHPPLILTCFTFYRCFSAEKRSLLVFFLLLLLSASGLQAQNSVGEWTMHLSYHAIHEVTGSENKVFGASDAGILVYHIPNKSVSTLNKKNGLNDVDISSLEFVPELEWLMIGYENGNVDIKDNNSIQNFPEIKDNLFQDDKAINQFMFFDDKILIATGFGIIEFIPSSKKFRNIFYPEEGTSLAVHDLSADDKNIYAATEKGVFYADRNSALINPSNWNRITDLPGYMNEFKNTEIFNGFLIASQVGDGAEDNVYIIDENNDYSLLTDNTGKVKDIYSNSASLFIAYDDRVIQYSENFSQVNTITDYPFGETNPLSLYMDLDNSLWIGDNENSLVRNSSSGQYESISRNSPLSDEVFKMKAFNDEILVTSGGKDDQNEQLDNPGIFYRFSEGEWKNYKLEQYSDFMDVEVDKQHKDIMYVSSFGGGLLKFENYELKEIYNSENSPLINTGERVQVSSLAADDEGNVLMVNYGATHPLVLKTKDDEWLTLEYDQLQGKEIADIVWAENGYLWGYFDNLPQLFVVDFNGTPDDIDDDRVRVMTPRDHNENLYADNITALVEDKNNNIWFATDEGIAVVNDIYGFFENDIFQPNRIRITEDNTTQYLLRDNTVKDILVDPGNRKWFATYRSGIKLFSEDGKKMLSHYTEENSPLLSNEVNTLAMKESSGELFTGSSKGIQSFRTDASEGKKDFSEAYVFPNPVKPGYDGVITITGLVQGVNVKITDVNGNLVYETVAEGGQATWDGKTLNGRKVNTGVYLVFMTNEDGSKTHIEKILFIR
ncbi:MAG: two-component regulator propeller domain-containing protein [Bacteroidales bacterium]